MIVNENLVILTHERAQTGQPLLAFLFTLVVDILSRMLIRATKRGVVKGLSVG